MNLVAGAPSHWTRTRVSEVFDILDHMRVPVNAKERANRPGCVPYYGATGQVGLIDEHLFDEDLVLLGEDGAPFLDPLKPKAYVIHGKSWVNNHAHVLRIRGRMPSEFWKYQLDCSEYRDVVSGTTRLKLPQGPMRTMELVLPPLAEQQRIVEQIDSYLSRLDAAVASLESVQAKLKAYRASVLKAAVEGRLVPTEAEVARQEMRDYEPANALLGRILKERRRRWEEAELARLTKIGKTPRDNKWKAKYKEPEAPDISKLPALPEGWCWASPGQAFDWSSGEFLPKKAQQPGPVPVFGGNGINGFHKEPLVLSPTLVVGRVGAQCGNLHITEGPAWITDNAIFAVEPPTSANLRYWHMVIGRQDLNANAGGTGQPYVNQKHLNDLCVPLAPAAEQERILDATEDLLSVGNHAAREADASIRRCARLRQSVLRWAFEGKLVDQDPSDEPVQVLLARLKAGRTSAAPVKKTRGRKATGAS